MEKLYVMLQCQFPAKTVPDGFQERPIMDLFMWGIDVGWDSNFSCLAVCHFIASLSS